MSVGRSSLLRRKGRWKMTHPQPFLNPTGEELSGALEAPSPSLATQPQGSSLHVLPADNPLSLASVRNCCLIGTESPSKFSQLC